MRPRKIILLLARTDVAETRFVMDTWGYRVLSARSVSEAVRLLRAPAVRGQVRALVTELHSDRALCALWAGAPDAAVIALCGRYADTARTLAQHRIVAGRDRNALLRDALAVACRRNCGPRPHEYMGQRRAAQKSRELLRLLQLQFDLHAAARSSAAELRSAKVAA